MCVHKHDGVQAWIAVYALIEWTPVRIISLSWMLAVINLYKHIACNAECRICTYHLCWLFSFHECLHSVTCINISPLQRSLQIEWNTCVNYLSYIHMIINIETKWICTIINENHVTQYLYIRSDRRCPDTSYQGPWRTHILKYIVGSPFTNFFFAVILSIPSVQDSNQGNIFVIIVAHV